MNKKIFVLVLASAFLLSLMLRAKTAEPTIADIANTNDSHAWPMHGHDPACTSYSPSRAPNTNATAWVTDLPGGTVWSYPIVAEGKVFLGTGGNFTAWNENTGSFIWSFRAPEQPGYPLTSAFADGRVFFGTAEPGPGGCIYALNATTGEQIWNFTTEGYVRAWPVVVEDRLYIGGDLDSTGKVYCINITTGASIWNYTTQDRMTSIAVAYGKVYASCGHWQTATKACIYCLDMYAGSLVWSFDTDRDLTGSLSVANGKVYSAASYEGSDCIVFALNATNGDVVWSTTRYSNGEAAGRTAVAYGKVFISLYRGASGVYALNETNGDEVWALPGPASGGPVVADGKVFFEWGDPYNSRWQAVNETTGTVVWSYELGGGVHSLTSAIANKRVFVADHYDPKLYAFGSAVTLPVHNIDTGLDYETIQEAIDAPETLDGHTIEVDSGTYIENVKVTKSLAIFGKDGPTATTVIAKVAGPVFDVMANYATIINFSVTNGTELSTDYYGAGIYLREVTHCNISNNIIYENVGIAGPTHGLYLSVSHSHIIVNNTIRNNGAHGIHLFEQGPGAPPPGVYGSHHNSIRENVIFGNNIGIYVLGSYNNLTDNIIHSNAGGICWRDSIHGMIENNTVTSNSEEGVQLQGCHDFIVRNNEISKSGYWCGLRLASSSNNTVSGNMLNENVGAGISIDTYYVNNGVGVPSLNNEIYENSLIKNDYGVMIRGLYEPHIDNVIYHNNFIDNIVGQAVDPWSNLWDDGYPSGGNYWSDYTGVDEYHGEYQNETCGDRIGDTPYVIDENNQDNYPLMGWSIPEDINNDGAVNILDIYTVAKAFGSYGPDYYPGSPPHERWNWRADINKDCKVDIRDIFRIALKYGWVA